MKSLFRSAACLLGIFLLSSTDRAEAASAVEVFNGKDLSGWKIQNAKANKWKIGKAALDSADPSKLVATDGGTDLVSPEKGSNLYSEEKYADCVIELEFMLSKGSNSGIKLMNLYEIQLLDSYGKQQVTASDCGAVYKESAPRVNATRKPGEWQTLLIHFKAPRFEAAGTKTSHAQFVKVVLNGQTIQENFEIQHGTNVPKTTKENARATFFLQGDHGPVAFRNIKVTPLD